MCIFFVDEQLMLCPWMYLTSWLQWSQPRSLAQARTSQTPCLSRFQKPTRGNTRWITLRVRLEKKTTSAPQQAMINDVYSCIPKIIYSKIHSPTIGMIFSNHCPNILKDQAAVVGTALGQVPQFRDVAEHLGQRNLGQSKEPNSGLVTAGRMTDGIRVERFMEVVIFEDKNIQKSYLSDESLR